MGQTVQVMQSREEQRYHKYISISYKCRLKLHLNVAVQTEAEQRYLGPFE